LAARGASGYVINPIVDDYVGRTFPGYSFFAVLFRQWPVAVVPPKGLASSNVFFVLDGEVDYMTNSDQLRDFFLNTLGEVQDPDEMKDVGRTWLRLTQEFSQDMFFRFSNPAVELTSTGVSGEVVVSDGGRGQIRVSMTFDADGVLIDVQETRKVVPGVRPICQATKLLHRDLLVRRMAEQDILVMGRAAKDYLDEQRAKARPALQRAIDRVWKRIIDEGR
jgi:hypothetical protein